MTVKPLGVVGAVIFFVCFVLWPAAPTYAEWPSIQAPKAGAHHRRTMSSPRLPRPRPAELPRESVELNKAAPEVAPAPTPVEASKVPEGGPAPKSDQTPDANRTPADSATINSAKASAEVAVPVEADKAPAAEPAPVTGSNKATPELRPVVSDKPAEAAAPGPIND